MGVSFDGGLHDGSGDTLGFDRLVDLRRRGCWIVERCLGLRKLLLVSTLYSSIDSRRSSLTQRCSDVGFVGASLSLIGTTHYLTFIQTVSGCRHCAFSFSLPSLCNPSPSPLSLLAFLFLCKLPLLVHRISDPLLPQPLPQPLLHLQLSRPL